MRFVMKLGNPQTIKVCKKYKILRSVYFSRSMTVFTQLPRWRVTYFGCYVCMYFVSQCSLNGWIDFSKCVVDPANELIYLLL